MDTGQTSVSRLSADRSDANRPRYQCVSTDQGVKVHISGYWISSYMAQCERQFSQLKQNLPANAQICFDLSAIEHLDTAGICLFRDLLTYLQLRQCKVEWVGVREEFVTLWQYLETVNVGKFNDRDSRPSIVGFLADIGESVVEFGQHFASGIEYLGRVAAGLAALVTGREKFRFTATIYQMDIIGFRSVPIITLINFLVGCIVAQQGIFQLQRFGASDFAVDLIGILVLRELGVLLTSIMIAGRSGSAITAEIGSMNMLEEVDALDVMGFDPMQVLVIPRILALIVSLPLLTFIADMAAVFGGLLVCWSYAGITPDAFLERLKEAILLRTFLSGIIKAPFMALVIALISTAEGLAVKGSAESLGRQVTSAVVKSIFMVILVDGLFAMFFASIRF